ncbi:MAG: branched-chain amino acid ABC transporter permease, partial [Alphaproteobacteria bacterium]|nr:branched-chain amino acid ABC transporter permease [Alphaproteobacteria bacterium]
MRYVDKTVIGLTIAFLVLLALNFVLAEWMRFIGLQSLARGAVALGLLVLWRSGLVSFGHALYFGFGAYTTVMLSL